MVSKATTSEVSEALSRTPNRISCVSLPVNSGVVEAMQNRMNEEQKENDNAVQQQIDELRVSLQKLSAQSNVVEDHSAEAIFKSGWRTR